jgi:hypothetical protein
MYAREKDLICSCVGVNIIYRNHSTRSFQIMLYIEDSNIYIFQCNICPVDDNSMLYEIRNEDRLCKHDKYQNDITYESIEQPIK